MNKFSILLIALFFIFNADAQNLIKGKVIDAETRESLAFANITFNGIKNKGLISDIDGNFKFIRRPSIKSIEVSYLGYENKTVKISSNESVEVALQPSLERLDEVLITNTEDPALRVVRKVIANSKQNNPLGKGGFKYTSYSKSIIDSKRFQQRSDSIRNAYLKMIENGKLQMDSDTISDFERTIVEKGTFHIAVLESVTIRKFLPPDLSEERVIASRVSGLKNAYLSMLATELQPFGFYKDNISLLDINFLNPIAKGSMKRYDYFLEKEIMKDNDTIFNISFQPKQTANIDGLKGFMYVNSDGYAIQNIVAEPAEELVTTLKVQQRYTQINDEDWFPKQLNFTIELKETDLSIDGKTYLKNIKFIDKLKRKDFSEVALKYEEDAAEKKKDFWDDYRIDSLSKKEQVTYHVIDSIGEELKFDKALGVINSLSTGNIPWGAFNLKLNRFMDYNKFEGFRLGAGFETNEKLFDQLNFGGYFAYGFKDHNWKFSGHARYNIKKRDDFSIAVRYSNDVREVGNSSLQNTTTSIKGNTRSLIASKMDIVEQYQLQVQRRDLKYLSWTAALRNEWVRPQYNDIFSPNSQMIDDYRNTEAIISLRYAHREQIVETPLRRFSLGSKYPIFNIRYVKGLDSFLKGSLDFHKIEANIHQSFYTKYLGRTRYHLQAGHIDGDVPFGLLFTGEGSYDKDFPVVMYDHFQTMFPYEFVSNSYIDLFLTHDLGSLLFKTEDFSPGVVLHHNMGLGNLTDLSAQGMQFNTKENLFIESGLELTNLLKLDAFGVNMGYGIGGFYRYGFYSLDKRSDNFVYKFNFSFSLRE